MEIGQSPHFSKGVGHFKCTFQVEGTSPTNFCWYQKARVIGCMFFCFVTKHACNEQTNRIMTPKTDRTSIAASRGKNGTHEYEKCAKCLHLKYLN